MKELQIGLYAAALRATRRVRDFFASTRGEGYVDSIVKMAIAVVIGALILGALFLIIGDADGGGLMTTVKDALQDLFDYTP